MHPPQWQRLERFDGQPDPRPQEPTVIIATIEHQVGALRRFGTVLSDQQIGGAPNVDLRNQNPLQVSILTLELTEDVLIPILDLAGCDINDQLPELDRVARAFETLGHGTLQWFCRISTAGDSELSSASRYRRERR
jgi:hypothetical protein